MISGLMRKQVQTSALIDVAGRSSLSSALVFLAACIIARFSMPLGFAVVIAGLIYEVSMKAYGLGLVLTDLSRNLLFWLIALLVAAVALVSFTYFRLTMGNVVQIFTQIMNLN